MLIGKRKENNKKMSKVMTNLMGPSKGPSALSSSRSTTADGSSYDDIGSQAPITHPEEPLLNLIPKGVFPYYRPISLAVRLVLVVMSVWTSAVNTFPGLTWLEPLAILKGWRKAPSVTELLSFVTKVCRKQHYFWVESSSCSDCIVSCY